MKCEKCGKDKNFFGDMFWCGKYRYFDTLFRIRKKKVYWCGNCMGYSYNRLEGKKNEWRPS